jgi:hypothetical protein
MEPIGMEPMRGWWPWSNWTRGGFSRKDFFIAPGAIFSRKRPSHESMMVSRLNTAA